MRGSRDLDQFEENNFLKLEEMRIGFPKAISVDVERVFAKFHRGMLERGVYLPPSQFEAAFLSTAHTLEDINHTVEAARATFKSFERTPATNPS